MRGHRNSANA
jgi:hypothetical protein